MQRLPGMDLLTIRIPPARGSGYVFHPSSEGWKSLRKKVRQKIDNIAEPDYNVLYCIAEIQPRWNKGPWGRFPIRFLPPGGALSGGRERSALHQGGCANVV